MANQKDHPGRIIVKNYPPDTSTRDLQIMFEKYGKIDDLFTPKNRENDKPRGFSFIRYRRVEDAEDAIRGMNGREIDGHKLLVEFSHGRGGGGGGASRGGRGPPVRGPRDDARTRRRSPSPRHRYRSRSASPRDQWRGRDREGGFPPRFTDREEFSGGHYHEPPHHPPPPPHQAPYHSRPHDSMMDVPPHHGMDRPYPSSRQVGVVPPMGGPSTHPPPNMQMAGGPPRHPFPGRKTLLNTPDMPPPHRPSSGGGGGGPGGHPPPESRHLDDSRSSHGHHPQHSSRDQHYRSPPDHFSGGPKHGGRGRESFSPRDSFRGGPPPMQGERGDKYPPRDESYYQSAPPEGYYEDRYHKPSSQQSSYHQDLPPPRDSYLPPSGGNGSVGRDGYSRGGYENSSSGSLPPSRQMDEYRPSGEYLGPSSEGGSGYRGDSRSTSGHAPSGYNTAYEYMGGYENERSGPPGGGYGPPQGGEPSERGYRYDNSQGKFRDQISHPPPRQLSPPASHRPASYESMGTHSGGGYPSRNEGIMPPPQTRKDYEQPESDGRYYVSQQSSGRGESRFSSGSGGGYQDQPSQLYSSKSASGYPGGPPQGGSDVPGGRVGSTGGHSNYPAYSVPSYSTGYGAPSSGSAASSQRNSSGGGSSGKIPTGGVRSHPTNTGFVPSQSYTKPGPPF